MEHRIKFRHLTCFLEVANQKSFVKASSSLRLTQPAVSKAISELEEELGIRLFNRSRSGVTLTYYGEAFRGYAGTSKIALEQGIASILEARNKGVSPIVVGALPTVAGTLMPRAIYQAKREGLMAKIHLITGPNEHLISQLNERQLHLVVGRMSHPQYMQNLHFEKLYSDIIVLVVRRNHPILAKDNVGLKDISNFPILLPNQNSIIRPEVDRLLVANGIANFEDTIESVSPTFCLNYVKITDAIWIISRSVVKEHLETGILHELPCNTSETTGPIGLTTNTAMKLSVSAELLVQAIRDSISVN